MKPIKNIVFDLGGVVFARDPRKFEPEFIKFFSFIALAKMPDFWEDYDRGDILYDEVVEHLARYNNCDKTLAEANLRRSILTQEEIPATKRLIEQLAEAGYNLYVLSNMSREFIDFLRRKEVYDHFRGDVVSCEEHIAKPDEAIYRRLLEKYDLVADETLFVDDREANIEAAVSVGIEGYLFRTMDADACCKELGERLLLTKNVM